MRMHSIMAQTEQAIAAAFVADKLSVHLVGGVQGPHTLTFGVKLYQPTKGNVAKALSLAGAVEAMTSLSPVRLYTERGVIFVEVPSPAPVIVDGTKLRGEGLAVPIGMSSRRAVVGIDFAQSPHLLLVGPTGQGKTTGARGIAYHLLKQDDAGAVRFIVSTFKPRDWKAFATLRATLAVLTDPVESMAMVAWLRDEMYKRTKAEVDTPHLFVFLDDLLNLLTFAGKECAVMLGEIASLGRGAGIHLVIGTQRSGESGAGSSIVAGNITTRLIFGTASAQDAAMFSGRGESGAEKLGRYKGDALLVSEGSQKRVAVAMVGDADLLTLPMREDSVRVERPWNDQRGTNADRSINGAVDRATSFTPENDDFEGWNVPADQDGFSSYKGSETPFDPRNVPLATRLPDAPPTEAEREYLRQLYVGLGSKRAVLKAAWGGVVNESGKTPKTQKWLDEALGVDDER
jgi:DNA polymerase III delta prime subunit